MPSKPKYYSMVDSVLGSLAKLQNYSGLHLTSIAKAIELSNPRINKIVFKELTGEGLNINGPGILLTQELEMTGYDGKKLITYEHYIFYETHKVPYAKVRFAVAHELGHILMHNPMNKHREDRIHLPVKDREHLFAVEYDPEDEAQADIFAMIMCEQRQAIERQPFTNPCIKFVQTCIDNKLASKALSKYVKQVRDCDNQPLRA